MRIRTLTPLFASSLTVSPQSPPSTAAVGRGGLLKLTLTYLDTEYLPSDLFRSVQLIRNLDSQEADHRGHLEWLTKEFANLPARAPHALSPASTPFASSSGSNGVPGGQAQAANGTSNSGLRRGSRPISDEEMEMRLQISRSINASIRTREESAAEAKKLHQNVPTQPPLPFSHLATNPLRLTATSGVSPPFALSSMK